MVKNWIDGSSTVKKNNAVDHLKSNIHSCAVLKLKEKQTTSAGKEIAQETSSQKTIVECAREISKSQKSQLIKNFQLAHFLTVKNKSFNFFKDMVKFGKEVHKVDVGTGYLSTNAAQEMVMLLSKSIITENITDPLNSVSRIYFSLLFDGSLSAKTRDEKDLYIIKTCDNGKARFDVLALEQPDDADANGLKNSLDSALSKENFTFKQKHREIGLGSDGANTNKALYHIRKEEVGDHLVSILCLSPNLELAIHDALKFLT